jgi:hypothetical protein
MGAGDARLHHQDDRHRQGRETHRQGRVLQAGRTNSVGAADVYSVSAGREMLCGTVLATTRNFQIRSPS